jgi:hypothetical protein
LAIELFVLCFDLWLLIIPVVSSEIKVREYRRDNKIEQSREICVGHHYAQANTNNVNIMKYIILDKCKYTTDAVDTTVYSAGFRTNEPFG